MTKTRYTLADMIPAPNLTPWATKYAPLLKLFPYASNGDPEYLPSSVDWYLNQVTLYQSGKTQIGPPVSESELPSSSSGKTLPYLQIPGNTTAIRSGNLASASAYVHLLQTPGSGPTNPTYDLQYWFFSPIRGMSTLYLMKGGNLFHADLAVPAGPTSNPPYLGAGEHQGDFKTATVRVDSSGNIIAVFFGQHSSGIWVLPGQYETTATGAPVMYCARNTHSLFPGAGQFTQVGHAYSFAGYTASLLEWTADGGDSWDTSQNLVVLADDTNSNFEGPPWKSFAGNWGPNYSQNIASGVENALGIAGLVSVLSKIPGLLSLIANIVARYATSPENGAANPQLQGMWSKGPGPISALSFAEASQHAPALAASNNYLYLGWLGVDSSSSLNILSIPQDTTLGTKKTTAQQSANAPSLTVFTPPSQSSPESYLYMAWTGKGSSGPLINVQNYLTNSDGSLSSKGTWLFQGAKSSYAPALTAFTPPGQLDPVVVLAWAEETKQNQIALLSSSTAGSFNTSTEPTFLGVSTQVAPALTSYDGALVLLWIDASGQINLWSSPSGTFGSDTSKMMILTPGMGQINSVSVAVFNDLFWLGCSSGQTVCYKSSTNLVSLAGLGMEVLTYSNQGPALAEWNNLLFAASIQAAISPSNSTSIGLQFSTDGHTFFPPFVLNK